MVRFVDFIQKMFQYIGFSLDQVALCSIAGGEHEPCAYAGHLPHLIPMQ